MTLHSAIYTGVVRHRRRRPRHDFRFPLFMVYLDLAETERVLAMTRLWGRSAWSPARFRREDYLRRDGLDLDGSVRRCVEAQTGRRPEGAIRMLTHLRYFGYLFNPVTFYYCHGASGALESVVAEITNTPWGERHAYVLECARAAERAGVRRWRFHKSFHVSPFLPMDLGYDWSFSVPSERLLVHMQLRDGAQERVFDATLRLRRRELTPWRMRLVLARYPLLTARVIGRIHFEALRLWAKGARVHAHPARLRAGAPGPTGGGS